VFSTFASLSSIKNIKECSFSGNRSEGGQTGGAVRLYLIFLLLFVSGQKVRREKNFISIRLSVLLA